MRVRLECGQGALVGNFAIPFACIGLVFLATYIVMTRKLSWSEYIGYMVAVVLFGQMPVMGILLGFTHFVWPSFAATGLCRVYILMMLLFANGRYKGRADAQVPLLGGAYMALKMGPLVAAMMEYERGAAQRINHF